MRRKSFVTLLTINLFPLFPALLFAQPSEVLTFKTSAKHVVRVNKGKVYFDKRLIKTIPYASDIIYESKSNRLIEDHGKIFLFIATMGNPNKDRLYVYLITPTGARQVADAILSPIKDYDGDGYLEFGGSDLTEMYPNTDSMYYIPSAYYQLKDGKITPDNSLTRNIDIKVNGVYIPYKKQLDKDGSCCVVILKPGKKHRHLNK